MKEIWKDIKGHEYYEVSNMGRVWNKKDKFFPKTRTDGAVGGTLRIAINGRRRLLHRIVAEAFIVNPMNKPYVVFKNFRNNDPRACNLVRVDQDELSLHRARRDKVISTRRINKLSEVELLRLSIDIEQGNNIMTLAISYDLNYSAVYFMK